MLAAGCLGAALCTAVPTADGHVSVLFFFFLRLLPPLSIEQHFPSPNSRSLSYCGGGRKGRGGRVEKEGAGGGRGQRLSPAPGGGRGRQGHRSLLASLSATPRGARSRCRHPERLTSASVLRIPAETSQEKRLKTPLCNPSCGAQTCSLVWLYFLGLGQVAAAPFGLFIGGESDAKSLKVTENTVERDTGPWTKRLPSRGGSWNSTRMTGGLPDGKAPPTVASGSPSRLQRPWRVLDRAWCRCFD